MQNQEFSGQRVLVTGAASGIGRHVAERFQALGANVIGFDRTVPQPATDFRLMSVDITCYEQVTAACNLLIAEQNRLDVLVNAAGFLRMGAVDSLALNDWHHHFDVNVTGTFYLLRQWCATFKRQGSGSIVNVASNAAHAPRVGMAAYCASKAALVSLSHCAGLELARHGVRCNVVSPGSTDTPMLRDMLPDPADRDRLVEGLPDQFKLGIPLGKIASTEDIVQAILFFASPRSSHITLQDLVVDGGATLAA